MSVGGELSVKMLGVLISKTEKQNLLVINILSVHLLKASTKLIKNAFKIH